MNTSAINETVLNHPCFLCQFSEKVKYSTGILRIPEFSQTSFKPVRVLYLVDRKK